MKLLVTLFAFCVLHLTLGQLDSLPEELATPCDLSWPAYTCVCPRGWNLWGNGCYKYFDAQLTWDDAENKCLRCSGHLASISSASEQNYVFNLWQSYPNINQKLWIGARKIASFTWSDGTPWSYTNWASFGGQPSGDGNCGHMWTHSSIVSTGAWNDYYCSRFRNPFVCELKPRCCKPEARQIIEAEPAPAERGK